jgi:hypothetical protein
MVNRRLSFRQEFDKAGRLPIRLDSIWQPLRLDGEIRNLSVGGMNVGIFGPVASLDPFRQCLVDLGISEDRCLTWLTAAIVHVHDGPNGRQCGMRFLPSIEPVVNQKRDQALWRFLLQQRVMPGQRQALLDSAAIFPRLFNPQED